MATEYLADSQRHGLVAGKVGRDEDRMGAKARRAERRHRGTYPKLPCLIRSRAHNRTRAMPGYNDWTTTESEVVTLLHGSEERIHINMHDLAAGATSPCLKH